MLAIVLWIVAASYHLRFDNPPDLSADLDSSMAYLERRPLAPGAWITLSQRAHEAGAVELRDNAIDAAFELASNRSFYLEPTLLKFYQYGRHQDLAPVAQRLMEIDSKDTFNIYSITVPLFGVKGFVEQVMPQDHADALFERSYYFASLFRTAISNDNPSMIGELWQAASDNDKQNLISKGLHKVFAGIEKAKGGLRVIQNISASEQSTLGFTGDVLSLNFSENSMTAPLCWNLQFHADSTVDTTDQKIVINSRPLRDRKGHLMQCYIPIKVGRPDELVLQGLWSSDTRDSRVQAQIKASTYSLNASGATQKRNFTTTKKGSWSNQPFNLEIPIASSAIGIYLTVTLPRSKTNNGRFTLQDMTLKSKLYHSGSLNASI